MPTLTTQAEEILSALETTPGLREELETYFARRWEAATGLEIVRESLETRIADLEDAREDEGAEYDDLRNAAADLCDAIERDRPANASTRIWLMIDAKTKTLKSLL